MRTSNELIFHITTFTVSYHRSSLDDGRQYRRSVGHAPKRPRPLAESGSNASSRGHGDYDEDSLRQLLLEYVKIMFQPN